MSVTSTTSSDSSDSLTSAPLKSYVTTLDMKVSLMKSKGNLQGSQNKVSETLRYSSTEGAPEVDSGIHASAQLILANQSRLTREAWDEYMCWLVRSKVCLTHLNDRDLVGVIHRAKKAIAGIHGGPVEDPDLPLCYTWNEKDVAAWFAEEGFSNFADCVRANHLTGRKLVNLEANALVKMGIRDIHEIRKITSKIRELLGIPRPNITRALARFVPYEQYLKRKARTGKQSEALTFKTFCAEKNYPYERCIENPSSTIPSCCPVYIYRADTNDTTYHRPSSESSSDNVSLADVPTVEFVVRNSIVHNRVVQQIIDTILTCVCEDPDRKSCKYGMTRSKSKTASAKTIGDILDAGFLDLQLTEADSMEKLQFATKVARSLLDEMIRTAQVLKNIEETQKYLAKQVTPKDWEEMKSAAAMFVEEIYPIVSILSVGDLNLESIFKQEPEFEDFVDQIIESAEETVESQSQIHALAD